MTPDESAALIGKWLDERDATYTHTTGAAGIGRTYVTIHGFEHPPTTSKWPRMLLDARMFAANHGIHLVIEMTIASNPTQPNQGANLT